MFHTALSRVNILHKKKRKVLQELCRLLVYKIPSEKRTGKLLLLKSRQKGQEKYSIENPSERDRNIYYCKPGSKDRVTNHCMYTNQPRPKDRAYDLKNQSHKTGNNTSI